MKSLRNADFPTSYQEAAKLYASCRTGVFAHNTCIDRHPDAPKNWTGTNASADAPVFAVRLYRTPIVVFYPDGRIKLNSGGWRTHTTKDRINRCLPPGVSVFQRDFTWYVSLRIDGKEQTEVEFWDGLTLHSDGTLDTGTRK